MDVVWRTRGLANLPTKPDLERALSLAIPPTDARHSRRRPRCGFGTVRLFLPAKAVAESAHLFNLADGIARAAFFRAAPVLSLAGVELLGFVRRVLCASREELLPRADLSHVAGVRSSGH